MYVYIYWTHCAYFWLDALSLFPWDAARVNPITPVNPLTMTPALLLSFPDFFTTNRTP